MSPHDALVRYFGFSAFRPGQEDALQHLLAGRDTPVVMPTGSGKSLIYQLAALMLPGTTLVLSPLVALIQQVARENRLWGAERTRSWHLNARPGRTRSANASWAVRGENVPITF